MSDVVAVIDALAAEEKCPHCDREWHELALTQSVARMFDNDYLDSTYFAREDTSPVVCDGSTFIGPPRPGPVDVAVGYTYTFSGSSSMYIDMQPWLDSINSWTEKLTESFAGLSFTFNTWFSGNHWSSWQEPEPLACEVSDGVEVEFGPQNWIPPQEPVNAPPAVKALVGSRMDQFVAVETHAPEKRPYDFSQFDWESPTYPTGKKGKKK